MAMVGGQVDFDFALTGLKNISEITTNWTWNGLGGDITDSGGDNSDLKIKIECRYW